VDNEVPYKLDFNWFWDKITNQIMGVQVSRVWQN